MVGWLKRRLVWMVLGWLLAPFLWLLAFFGVCWAIDLLDRMGALRR